MKKYKWKESSVVLQLLRDDAQSKILVDALRQRQLKSDVTVKLDGKTYRLVEAFPCRASSDKIWKEQVKYCLRKLRDFLNRFLGRPIPSHS
jgi:hypothetical protein